MIEIIIGFLQNIPNPNSNGVRSDYEAEEGKEVEGEKAASGDVSKEGGAAVGTQWPPLGQGLPLWDWKKRAVTLSSIWWEI